MSEENIQILGRAIEMVGEGIDPEAGVNQLYHPEVEVRDLHPPPDVPEFARGRDEVIAILEKWTELFDDWSVEVIELIDLDPWVVADIRWRGTGKGSDADVEWRVADVFEMRDGMVYRAIHNFADREAALEAVRGGDATLKALKASQD